MSIPIFEGFSRGYAIKQAQAQAEYQRDALEETQQQVGLELWTSYEALKTATENLMNSASLENIAQQTYTAVLGRYRTSAANIIELLSAQSSSANAKELRVQALAEWRTARLQFAGKLGKLGLWSL